MDNEKGKEEEQKKKKKKKKIEEEEEEENSCVLSIKQNKWGNNSGYCTGIF